MARHITEAAAQPLQVFSPRSYAVRGSFAPNGASAINAANNDGAAGLWSVERVSPGLFRITLTHGADAIESVKTDLQLATAADRKTQIGSVSLANRTVEIRVIDSAGTAQDVAANANNRIHFDIQLRGSSRKNF